MKKLSKVICILFLIFSSGCMSLIPHPRTWTKSEKTAALFFIVAHTADALTTEAHQDYPEMYYEMNPVLGKHPTDSEINTYFSLTGIATLITVHFYPELRKPVLYGCGGVNAFCAWYNINMVNRNDTSINLF